MNNCAQTELVSAYAMNALPAGEAATLQTHLASCVHCQRELQALRPVVDTFAGWPTDVLRPTAALQGRLALRIAEETGGQPVLPPASRWKDPEWENVAPGISVKLLANDEETHLVSMLVRLAPGGTYPAHTHAATEELHLLEGELWIDGRKLYPGDYNLGRPGEGDQRVYSETGCTCLLVTSTKDVLK